VLRRGARDGLSPAFWAVIGASLVVGTWLIVLGNLVPAATVLLSGAGLAFVLAFLARSNSGLVDRSTDGLRRRGVAMLCGALALLAFGAVVSTIGGGAVWKVPVFAGGSLTLAAAGVLATARHGDDDDSSTTS